MLKKYLKLLKANPNARRESLWATKTFTCDAESAAEFNLTEDTTYELWVAQKDGKTKSGSEVKKGEWFVVEKK